MDYIIYFDVAALVIFILILYAFYTTYQNPIAENRMLKVLIWLTFLSVILDLAIGILYNTPVAWNRSYVYLLNWLYFVFRNSLMIFYAFYLVILTDTQDKLPKSVRGLLLGVITIDVVVLLSDFLLHWVFYLDEAGRYHRGPALIVLYITTVICMVFAVVYIVINGKSLEKRRRLSLYVFPMIPFIGAAIQLFFPNILVEGFGVAVSILWVFMNIPRPEQLIEPKTKAMNKTAFVRDTARILMGKRDTYVLGISICEYESFKRNYGVLLTSSFLKEITVYLQHLSKSFRVYYVGKGHFFILMNCLDKNTVKDRAAEINQRFTRQWVLDDVSIIIRTAIVFMNMPSQIECVDQIFDYIDCLSQKESSQIYHVYQVDELDITSRQRAASVEKAIERALEQRSLAVYYQPIYDTKLGKVVTAEALVRLFDEELGSISPEEFIPIAEKSGKVIRIGEYVFREVCKFIVREDIGKMGIEYIEVNLSAVECMQSEMAEHLLLIMKEYKIRADQINFEITETAAASNLEMLSINMHSLFTAGIKFSLDDYGTGYSNIRYMMNLPFQIVKIDKSILWSSFENEKAMIAMYSSIRMIQEMNMQIVVEGVETKEMMDKLVELGCDYLQGYYFSKPVPPEEFIKKIGKYNLEVHG